MKNLILASASPRRKQLLEKIGLEFSICPSKIDEEEIEEDTPEKLVKTLAYLKAKEVSGRKKGVVIGADTVVSEDGRILEKPSDKEETYQMLAKLQGGCHQVFTGVALISGSKIIKKCYKTEVKFRQAADEEIYQYIATGEPMDKAGAYGIQGKGAIFVKEIRGCFYNVMGLPVSRVVEMLRKVGIEIDLNG